jgi:hypothetical protein
MRLTMKDFISKCCRSEAQIVFSGIPDFIGGDPKKQEVGTCWFRCVKCDKPCDILPLEEDWSLRIERASDGYILKGIAADGSDSTIKKVIEDDEEDELRSHEKLLWAVMEYFNFQGTKHDKKRLFIVRNKQK